jgi:hypothetical protein
LLPNRVLCDSFYSCLFLKTRDWRIKMEFTVKDLFSAWLVLNQRVTELLSCPQENHEEFRKVLSDKMRIGVILENFDMVVDLSEDVAGPIAEIIRETKA